MNALISAGIGLASNLIGSAFGRKQGDKSAEKNRQADLEANKEFADYQQDLQFDLWNKTNYPAQVEKLKEAGLNPTMLYGKGGGGGATTGNAGSGGISGKAQNIPMDLNIANQINQAELIKAQTENMKADAELKKAQAHKTAGVDTDKGRAEVLNLTQGVENQKAQEELIRVQTRLATIQETKENETIDDYIDRVAWEARKAEEDYYQITYQNYVSKSTREAQIVKIKNEAIGTGLQNILTKAQIGKTIEETKAIGEEVKQKWTQISQGWIGLNQGERKLQIEKFVKEMEMQYPNHWNVAGRAIDDMITQVVTLGGTQGERYKTKTIK